MRRPLLVLAVLALTAGLVACGDGDGDGSTTIDAVDLIRSSPDAMADVGTLQMTMRIDVAGEGIDGEGAFDLETGAGRLVMAFPEPLGEMETIFDGDVYFMNSELFAGMGLTIDEPWIRVDLDELAAMSSTGIDLSNLGSASSNPTNALDGLEAVAEDGLEELGTQEIDGVTTTGYAAEIDMAAALEQVEEAAGGESLVDEDQAREFLDAFGNEPVEVEVWVDDEGLTRRYELALEVQGQRMTQTMDFFAFGEPVDIDVPDEDESVSLTEVLAQVPGFDD